MNLRLVVFILICCALGPISILAQDNPVQEEDLIYVTAVAWSHDGSKIAAVGIRQPATQGYLRVIDVQTGNILYTLDPSPGGFTSVAWSADDRYIAVGGYDQVVWVFDVEARTHVTSLWGHRSTVTAVDWNSDGSELVSSGNWDGLTILWDMITYEQIRVVESGNLFPLSVDFTPDNQRIAIGGEGGIRIHPSRSDLNQNPVWYFKELNIGTLAWSHDGSRIAFGTQTFPSIVNPNRKVYAQLYIVDGNSGAQLNVIPTEDQTIYGLVWSPDDRLIATYSIDGFVRIWEADSGTQLENFPGTTRYPEDISFSPYGGRLAYGGVLPGDSAALTLAPQTTAKGETLLAGGAVRIVVPAPSAARLESILARCASNPAVLSSTKGLIESRQFDRFTREIARTSAAQIPPGCAADLTAMAEALQAGQ